MNTQNRLITLPAEIQLIIAFYLTPPEKVLLRSTCTHYHNFLPPPSDADLEEISVSPYNFKAYGLCLGNDCRKLYPRGDFAIDWDRELENYTYTCKRCQGCTTRNPFMRVQPDCPKSTQAFRLRKLRQDQGLGRAFWDVHRNPVLISSSMQAPGTPIA